VNRRPGASGGPVVPPDWRSPATTISLIIPAYNEARHLGETLPRLRAEFLDDPNVELIVVDDGSTDRTAEMVLDCIEGWEGARLIRMPWNQGKGSAIKAGIAAARGSRLVFSDADLSADIRDLPRLVAALDHADVAIGSRAIAGSRVIYNQHRGVRKIQSKFFNGVACAMVDIVASDTQCGFKAFRADAGKMLFHLCEAKGFAFDVELLALAQLLGLRVTEVPVDWVESVGTTVKPIRDPIRMMRDLLRTRRRCRKLETAAGRFVWEVAGPAGALDGATNASLPEQYAFAGSALEQPLAVVDLAAAERAETVAQHTDTPRRDLRP
jgi:glycosyltransferase involved in cell wall biosynthesis